MATSTPTTDVSGNDSRRRVVKTPIVKGWNGGAAATQVLSDNVGLAQHQIWWNSTGATAGTMTISVRPAKGAFFVPVATVNLATTPNGVSFLMAILDDVQLSVAGLAGTLSLSAGINSVGVDFTPGNNRSLVDRRRFQVMEVASGWNGTAAITSNAPDHQGYAQHQLAIAGGVGNVKLQARPLGAQYFVDLTSDVQGLPASGALAIFPGMYDAFQLVPVGTVTGSINASIISIAQEMFLPVTPWQVSAGIGYVPANDANVVHLTGSENITGYKTFGNNTFANAMYVYFNTAAGNNRAIAFQSAGLNRWVLVTDNSAESGGNAGSNLSINRFNDAGAFIDTPFNINRATGNISMASTVGFFGAGVGPTASSASWASVGNLVFANNAEWSTGTWLSQRATTVPMNITLNSSGFNVFYASTGAPTGPGQPVSWATALTVGTTGAVSIAKSLQVGGGIQNYAGNVNAQIGLYAIGWNNDVTRWLEVLEGDASYSLYSYDATGAYVAHPLNIFQSGVTIITTSNQAYTLAVQDTGGNGASIQLIGNGTTNPQKKIRSRNGNLEFVNSANTSIVTTMDDLGDWTLAGLNTHTVSPSSDNAYPLGGASNRWSVVYSATGTINTSDQREKFILGANTLGLDFVNSLSISQYKYLVKINQVSETYDENGVATTTLTPVAGVRTHIGTMAQSVVTALQNAGIDPSSMGLWTLDDPADPTSRQGLRENELMWILWTATQQLSSKVTSMQSDIAALKAKVGL